ncbi:hypothetical protein BU17DRAFT_104137 [Hysterangium stoloniferum]|nr:hypothetical protein BU17DRAFT_104137 [Hysterangium stoloniferum]
MNVDGKEMKSKWKTSVISGPTSTYVKWMQPPFNPNIPTLIQQLYATTHNTFALMQSIVQMFRGFAQMVESTYMTTDSSFFAMGLFAMVRLFRGLITGQLAAPSKPQRPKPSKKLLIFFLIALFGIPFLMHRIIRSLSPRLPPPNHLPNEQVIDPSNLVFARPGFAFNTKDSVKLALRAGGIVAILGTVDPVTGVRGALWIESLLEAPCSQLSNRVLISPIRSINYLTIHLILLLPIRISPNEYLFTTREEELV